MRTLPPHFSREADSRREPRTRPGLSSVSGFSIVGFQSRFAYTLHDCLSDFPKNTHLANSQQAYRSLLTPNFSARLTDHMCGIRAATFWILFGAVDPESIQFLQLGKPAADTQRIYFIRSSNQPTSRVGLHASDFGEMVQQPGAACNHGGGYRLRRNRLLPGELVRGRRWYEPGDFRHQGVSSVRALP